MNEISPEEVSNKYDPYIHIGNKIDVLDHGSVELVDAPANDPVLKIVNSARVSHSKQSNELNAADEKLVAFLYDHGHFSTYRHSYFSFRVKAPLFVFRQWWKYQIGSNWMNKDELADSIEIPDTSWNEASGRYVNLSNDFYIPAKFRRQSKVNKQGSSSEPFTDAEEEQHREAYVASQNFAKRTYDEMVADGVAKEVARCLLPQSIYSECIWTCSTQTLIHFFNQRLSPDAQHEIREYATAVRYLVDPILGKALCRSA